MATGTTTVTTTTTPAARVQEPVTQAQELETWIIRELFLKPLTSLIGEYLVNDSHIVLAKYAADHYEDSAWIAALEAAKKSSCFFLKHHEVVSWTTRLNLKVASDGHIQCDEVLLKNIRFEDQKDSRPTSLTTRGSPSFYLASNQLRFNYDYTECLYRLDNATTETHFWVTQAGKTHSVTIGFFPLQRNNPSVFSIDARNTVQTIKRVTSGGYNRFVQVYTPPNPLDNSLVVISNNGLTGSPMLVLRDPNVAV